MLPPSSKNLSQVFIVAPQAEGKLLIPQGSVFSKICFSHQQKGSRRGGNYNLLYQNSIKNMKMTWYIRLFTLESRIIGGVGIIGREEGGGGGGGLVGV